MRILLAFLFLSTILHAQSGQKPPAPVQDSDDKCYHNGKLKPSERLKNYPFNEAQKVLLVSFDEEADWEKQHGTGGLIENYTPVFRDTLFENKLHEKQQLSKAGIDSLTDVLYSFSYKKTPSVEKDKDCYQPRNAIVFINKDGQAFAFIEVCFECQNYKTSDAKILTGDFCEGKYELLRNFFKKEGIKTGVVK
jgi:cytochrome oxidase Cu insertion factor (SCO1/SenC/PrrC family)